MVETDPRRETRAMIRPAHNGGVSFWYSQIPAPEPRRPLPGDLSADVCIIGAGFTGLWSAYYLKRARPELEIAVVEREFAGFGASGRNGGWLYDGYAGAATAIARSHGPETVRSLRRLMRATIDEVIGVCGSEGIDAEIVKHGVVRVARGPAQVARLRRAVQEEPGDADSGLLELDRDALQARIRVARGDYGLWRPHGARIQPAKLVQGLAAAVERLGVQIYERTRAREVQPGAVRTDRGTLRAATILMCLEGFTPSLRGERRRWLPLNSAMIATAPLPGAIWQQIGWSGAELLDDAAHAYFYAQRTADGRIALGGRGVPYRFASRTDRRGETQTRTLDQLVAILHDLFPAARAVPIEHGWCGVLGVPRDWTPAIGFDRSTGIGLAGGYVGQGVSTSNLAARTLRDLVLGEHSELTRLPWVGRRARAWEPEPLRWLGARLVYGLYRAADRRERRGGTRTSRLATAADALAGRR
jgi:glycine/D-amino acid oxidase-like deaminating enzyme